MDVHEEEGTSCEKPTKSPHQRTFVYQSHRRTFGGCGSAELLHAKKFADKGHAKELRHIGFAKYEKWPSKEEAMYLVASINTEDDTLFNLHSSLPLHKHPDSQCKACKQSHSFHDAIYVRDME